MGETNTATERQVKLIEQLYQQLQIRNTSLYGGAPPAQLTKQRASEVIDILTLRKLSGQLSRPVTADLTDPVQVREQLARVQQLADRHHTRHAAATAKRAEHLRNVSQLADLAHRQAQQPATPKVRPRPHLRRQEQPQPAAVLTAEQLSRRAAELDRVKEPRLDATSRYSDATGYGSSASYAGSNERSSSDAPALTDEQERKIIELQDARGDITVSNTVAEASEYLDHAIADPEPPPTQRQLAYLHKLERQAGKTDDQLSRPGTRLGASRRIQHYLDAASKENGAGDLRVAMALADAASPDSIVSVTQPTQIQDDRGSDPARPVTSNTSYRTELSR